MNHLILTFDGFGDGVIYYEFFQEIAKKYPHASFFYTSNIFFSDEKIMEKIQLAHNFISINHEFRKCPKSHWDELRLFIKKNNIKTIINLRTIGRRYESDYYNFKDWLYHLDNRVVFYDVETLEESEITGVNIRYIVSSILGKALKDNFTHETSNLKSIFVLTKKDESILINMHSRGNFKLWGIDMWAELISQLATSHNEIKIYEGIGQQEITYTHDVLRKLPTSLATNVKIIHPTNLYDAGQQLRDAFLLVSVDSGYIHLADAIGLNSLGIYITTSPVMWGGVTKRFHYVFSRHMLDCKNFYPYFGMCMNNKKKCDAISSGKDDIGVAQVLDKIDQIYHEKES